MAHKLLSRAVPRAQAFAAACVFLAVNIEQANAEIGGTAHRGDNCTPIGQYTISLGMPSGGRLQPIINQSTILAEGWRTVGWVLTLRDGSLWLLPFPPASPGMESLVVPPLLSLKSRSVADVKDGYARYDQAISERQYGYAPIPVPKQVVFSDCFSAPLPPVEN